jgi:hypothetical protein
MRMKGQFTIANLVAVAVLLFIFAHTFKIQKQVLLEAAQGSGLMLTAVLYSIPAVELLVILGTPFMLAELKAEKERENMRRRRK